MTENQTLVMYSGHPMGLFPSSPNSPRVVITNGMVNLPSYSTYYINLNALASIELKLNRAFGVNKQ